MQGCPWAISVIPKGGNYYAVVVSIPIWLGRILSVINAAGYIGSQVPQRYALIGGAIARETHTPRPIDHS